MIGRLFAGLFGLIGYVCTATVITLVAGLAYLWQTDRLNDEKLFRMVALFHEVDLHQLADAQRKTVEEVPSEEVSLEEALQRQQVLDRDFEIKLLALRRGKQEYDLKLQELTKFVDRSDQMAADWETKLRQQAELTTQQNLAIVVGQLEAIQPPQAKEELLRWVKEGRMDDAILLMTKMSEGKLRKILQKFQSAEELQTLYEIHQRIIDSGEQSTKLDQALDELKAVGAGNKAQQ